MKSALLAWVVVFCAAMPAPAQAIPNEPVRVAAATVNLDLVVP